MWRTLEPPWPGAVIVLDVGSYSCRVGFATHEAGDAERAELEEAEEAELRLAVPEGPTSDYRPEHVTRPWISFTTQVARPKYGPGCMLGAPDVKEVWIGEEVEGKEPIMIIKHPVCRGIVENWDDLERIFHHVFYNHFSVDLCEHPVVLTHPAAWPAKERQHLVMLMFETFDVPWVSLFCQQTLSLYASGRTTGLVLDCGDTVCRCVPIYEGFVLLHAVSELQIGGREITTHVQNALVERYKDLKPIIMGKRAFGIAEGIKEEACYVAQNYRCELSRPPEPSQVFAWPSLQRRFGANGFSSTDFQDYLFVHNERFTGPEILFEPGLGGHEGDGVHRLVQKSLRKSDSDVRDFLQQNVLLAGGSSLFPGFPERLTSELHELMPGTSWCLEVIALAHRKHGAFMGAAQTGLVEHQIWISYEEYLEKGPTLAASRFID